MLLRGILKYDVLLLVEFVQFTYKVLEVGLKPCATRNFEVGFTLMALRAVLIM